MPPQPKCKHVHIKEKTKTAGTSYVKGWCSECKAFVYTDKSFCICCMKRVKHKTHHLWLKRILNQGVRQLNDILNEYEKAIQDYTKTIELNPSDAAAYSIRGDCYSELAQYEKAINDYSKAIELKPSDAVTYNHRGVSYFLSGNTQQSIKDYTKAIELAPQLPNSYGNRATSYYFLKEYLKAIEDYTKVIGKL